MDLENLTFIFLYRKLLDSVIFKNEGLLKVWIWCLLKATHSESQIVPIVTGKGVSEVKIKKGQFIFGRKTAAKELNMPESTVRNKIKKLKKLQKVTIQPDKHYSIVSIINWNTYQSDIPNKWRESGQAKDRQRTGKGHNQECKERKNEKKKDIPQIFVDLALRFFERKKKQTNVKLKYSDSWAEKLYDLKRIDKYSIEQITNALKFALDDSFWSKRGLLSLNTIRDKKNGDLTKV